MKKLLASISKEGDIKGGYGLEDIKSVVSDGDSLVVTLVNDVVFLTDRLEVRLFDDDYVSFLLGG